MNRSGGKTTEGDGAEPVAVLGPGTKAGIGAGDYEAVAGHGIHNVEEIPVAVQIGVDKRIDQASVGRAANGLTDA